ncbi:MAG: PepSY domain-containing protein [Proteobacteria bacterium]|nr:MAG: PepSY domain-containing protein [Pseudomonadota bacterium]
MKSLQMAALMATLLLSTTVLADDDCTDPVADWQPQENLRQLMIDNGWEVKRIKVDDGCYEVKGFDQDGHRVEAKFSPVTLEILELEVKFRGSGNRSGYLKKHRWQQKSGENIKSEDKNSQKRPKVNIQ